MIWKLITGVMTLLLVFVSLLFLDLFEALTLKNGIIAGSVGVAFIVVLVLIDVFTSFVVGRPLLQLWGGKTIKLLK